MPVLARVGSADQAVSPWYTRRMVRIALASGVNASLTELTGKEHWWWDTKTSNDGGAVNDAQLRRFFKMCSSRSEGAPAGAFTLATANPASTGQKHGLRVLQQSTPYVRSTLIATPVRLSDAVGGETDSRVSGWHVATDNVRKFSVATGEGLALHGGLVSVDGQRVDVTPLPGGDAVNTNSPIRELCRSGGDGVWHLCDNDADGGRGERGPASYGPLRQVLESSYVIVYGTGADAAEASELLTLAVFLANLFYVTSDGAAPVLPDTASWEDAGVATRNVVFVGGPRWNRWARHLLAPHPPVVVGNGTVALGGCHFGGHGLGVASLLPLVESEGSTTNTRLGLLLDGTDIDGVGDVVRLATPTIPPMVRQPFTNTLPDYVVTSPSVRTLGAGGFLAVGYWGNAWEWRADTSYVRGCTPAPANAVAKDDVVVARDDL
jgi:hypothetical protein